MATPDFEVRENSDGHLVMAATCGGPETTAAALEHSARQAAGWWRRRS